MLDTTLEQLVLHTLRATIVANPYTQNHFRSIGGLEVLLDGIQTPPMEVCGTRDYTLTENNSTNQQVDLAHTVEIPSLSKLAEGFQLKLLCFQVLRESVYPPFFAGVFLFFFSLLLKYMHEKVLWRA
jgi:hypothetical protein